jgi:hypothetical protein
MTQTNNIESISFENDLICLQINGEIIKIPIAKVSKKLTTATHLQRNFYKVSPSGYGVHWPLIDEDLSVASLLKNV